MRSRNRSEYENYSNVFYVTSTIVGFVEIFKSPAPYNILLDSLKFFMKRRDFTILAYVLMPNHFHLIIRLNGELSVSQCMAYLKRFTSKRLTEELKKESEFELLHKLAELAKLEPSPDCRIWKPRFDCLVITSEETLRQKTEYIHNNPIKKGLVSNPLDWMYSSARNYAGFPEVVLDVDTEWQCLEA